MWGVVCAPPLEYRSESTSYTYPEWATAIGWLISVASIFFVPTVAIYKLFSFRATSFKQARAPAACLTALLLTRKLSRELTRLLE